MNILVQEYIKEAAGIDVRALVVGGEVVATMKRSSRTGEFRANLHRGGKAEAVALTEDERQTALRSAEVLGLNVAGVDMLRSNRGPVVIEVNSSPGIEGMETGERRRRGRRHDRVPGEACPARRDAGRAGWMRYSLSARCFSVGRGLG